MTDPVFREIVEELILLHEKKGADYGSEEDPLGNLRAAEKFGIPAWVGTVLRANDKMARIQRFVNRRQLRNESVEDSLRDLAVYAILGLQLYREQADAQ